MSDLIDKQALQTELLGLTICDGYEKDYIHAIYDRIQNAPTINPDDLVKHGEWEEVRKENIWGDFVPVFKCSACRKYKIRTIGIIRKSNYCPNCGAKMDGGKRGNG